MKKFAIALRTKKREKINYIDQTIDSIVESYDYNVNKNIIEGIHIYSSTPEDNGHLDSAIIQNNCYINVPNTHLNPNETSLFMIESILQKDFSHILLCEDDIEFCHGWLDYLLYWKDHFNPDDRIPLTTLYTPYNHIDILFKNKEYYWKYNVKDFYGTQCILISKKHLNIFYNFFKRYLKTPEQYTFCSIANTQVTHKILKYRSFDFWLREGMLYIDKNIKYFLSVIPCLVQHLGDISSIGCSFHTADGYYGKNQNLKEVSFENK